VSHPNVVAAYDVGQYGELVTMVMEFVDGVTLRSWLGARPRSAREVLALFAAIGAGLSAAHEADVVHRDMKPENVLVGADGRPRVTDFGLALTSPMGHEPPQAHAGTLPYMAPEQLLGRRVDARTDQFAFAVTLHEALLGTRPFAGSSSDALVTQIQRGLSTRAPRGVALRVWRALGRALAEDPERRFPSMRTLLDELLPRAPRAGKVLTGFVATVALVAAAYGLVHERRLTHDAVCRSAGDKLSGVWDARRKENVRDAFRSQASLPFAESALGSVEGALDDYARKWAATRIDVCEATRVRGDQSEALLDERMACLDDRKRELGFLVDEFTKPTAKTIEMSVGASTGLSSVESCTERRPLLGANKPGAAEGPKIEEAREALARAKAKVDVGDIKSAENELALGLPSWKNLGDARLVSEAELLLGVALSWGDDLTKAEDALLEAAWSAESVGDDDSVARAFLRLAQVAGNLMANQITGARYERQAEATLSRLGKPPDLEAELYLAQAMRLGRAANYEGARSHARDALDLLEAHGRGDTAMAATCWNTLSIAAKRQGKITEARDGIQRTLDIRERVLGARHPLVAHSRINLGTIELDEGSYADALATFDKALVDLEASTGPVTADTAMLHNNRGIAEVRLHDFDKARVEFERGAAIGKEVFGDHPSTALYVMNLGDLDRAVGRPADAKTEYARAEAILGRGKSPDAHTEARILAGRGQAELDQKDAGTARRTLEQALANFDKGSFDPADRADVEFALARSLLALHERGERATELAASARAAYAKSLPAHQEDLAAVDAWLRANAPPPSP
jgi:eukaryotic-like serine/threonine-protein kinase